MRALRRLLAHVGIATLWPGYLLLLSAASRTAPWPRSLARPVTFVLECLALALLLAALARFLLGRGRWVEQVLRVPGDVTRQWRHAIWLLVGTGVIFLIPAAILQRGLIAPENRPVYAPAIARLLVLGFESIVLGAALRLLRSRSAMVLWLAGTEGNGWLGRHRRALTWPILAAIGAIIGLDAQGYGFTARRLALAGCQTTLLVGTCGAIYWVLVRAIDHHAWRWIRTGHWAAGHWSSTGQLEIPDDVAGRLRRLTAWIVPILGLVTGVWVWRVDLALFRSIGVITLWPAAGGTALTVGDISQALVLFTITVVAWRHLSALFAVVIYPRMPDDPGLRFAALMLCRYAVLGLGTIAGLSALHLGLEKIGMVLAALGVGLGFGLQEIVSNFVSGVILLLERPIRVGDIVTVSNMTGRVDRINIRATTIINADNQCMIVPNREFITGQLVNWTHKDRVARVGIRLGVAYGNDPDRVADLLLTIARDDPDVLLNPVPSAQMEAFGASTLDFSLYVHVADPSLVGRVRHRLCAEIQRRFEAAGIKIPLPAREFHLRGLRLDPSWFGPARYEIHRVDPAANRPQPHLGDTPP
ncbi:MAG: mechanosensitive ion channel, partial [Isosphaeraceae bacterium]|nr:mechanosensitive ion channel [Isosphaeraceae bacterium]